MSTIAPLRVPRGKVDDERQLRVDLAAAFRMAAMLGWHEGVANHFSAAVSADGKKFLMNPCRRHFSRVKASDLLLLDADDPDTLKRPVAPDPAGWCIHGTLHAGAPQARVVLHLHPPYATAVSCLADPEIKAIDQTTARYYNRVAIDREFGGIADNMAEGRRILGVLGNRKWMMMGGHGVLVAGETVAEAYHDLYYLERACQTLTLARANGTPLNLLPHEVAERTAEAWTKYTASAYAHFDEMKAILDEKDPSYAE